MKLTLYPNPGTRPSASSYAPSSGIGSLSKRLSNAPAGHLHPPMKHDLHASYIAKPNLSINNQMKNLTVFPVLNSLKSNLASVRFLVTTLCIIAGLFSVSDAFGQITQVGTGQTATGTNTVTINKPSGIAVGDLMIATISYSEDGGGIDLNVAPTATGWTLIQDVNIDNSNGDDEWRGAVFYKVAVLADVSATNYLFDLDDQANSSVGGIVAFTGVDLVNPFDVTPGSINVTNSDVITALSITPVNANSAIVMLGMVSDNNALAGWTTTSPGALTEIMEANSNTANDVAVGAAWAIKSSLIPPSTGNGTTSPMAGTDQNGGILLALRQACSNVAPTVPTVSASPDPFCPGQSVTLTITGTLNDADYWAVYTGSCGGTLLGTTATNAFVVNPSATTTYYVRGEGPCIPTPGSCGQVVVDLNPNVPGCTNPILPGDNAINVSLSTNLDWQAASCVTGYKIYFGTNFPPTNIENGTVLGNVLTYNPASLNPNTVYNWRIVPYNANGDAVGCEDWQFTTGDGTPDCTTPVFPFNGATGLNPAGINLQWAVAPDATSYVLFFGTNNPPTNIVNGTNLGNVTTYATGALSMGTTYYWRIRPQNSFGDAGTCAVWSFTTDLDGIVFCDDCTDPAVLPECADPGTDNNPDLSANCAEISIAFVLDESGSVSGNQADVENGTMNLLSSLSCTGASVAMIEFNGYARYLVSDYEYVDDAYVTAAQNYFDDTAVPFMNNQIYEPGGYPNNDQGTNWQAALLAVDELPFAPDLIIFLTDGVPTGYSTGANPTYNGPFSYCSSGSSTQVPEIVNPIKLTNKFKGEGSHIFVVGVGNVTVQSIQEISGTTAFVDGVNNIGNSDYAIGSFAQLSNGLAALVADLCPFDSDVTSSDICEGSSNGSIFITVPSNLLPFNYEYYRNNVFIGSANGINVSPFELSGLIAGNYRVEVEVTLPGSGCTRTEIFFDTISTGAPLLVSSVTSTSNPTCLDPNAGSATLTVTVGPAPYVILLKKGGVPQPGYPDTTNVNPYVVTGLDFGNYSFDVYNIDSCNIDINPFTLLEPTDCCPLTCTVTGGPGGNVCPNTEATFGVTTSGGTCTTPTYSWSIISNTTGASIVGSSTNPSVTVNSGTTCGSYTIQSSVTCSGCSPLICTQVVNVVDNTQPTITTCAVTRNIEGCNTAAITGPNFSTTTTSSTEAVFENGTNQGATSDNCAITTVTYIDVAVGTCPTVVTRTWTISDACGNSRTCNQTINVDDTVNPTITTCAQPRTIEGCGASSITGPDYSTVSASSTEAVFENATNLGVASDACGITSVTYIDVAVGSCPTVVTRTWTISDACGNTNTCNQTITVDDTVMPTITTCAVTRNIEGCNTSAITGPNFSTVSASSSEAEFENGTNQGVASDACGITSVTYIDVAVGTCPTVVTRTWTISDACGNVNTCNQTINVDDNTNPTIDCSGVNNLVLECAEGTNYSTQIENWITAVKATILADPQTTDACDATLVISDDYNGTAIPTLSCGQTSGLVVTFTVMDDCGNIAACTKTVYLDDNALPTIDCSGVNDLVLVCVEGADYAAQIESWITAAKATILADPQTDDACDAMLSIVDDYNGTAVPTLSCNLTTGLTVTFTVSDECGNTAACTKTVYLDDNTNPTIDCSGVSDLVLECVNGSNYASQIEAWITAAKATILADPQTDDACDGTLAIVDDYNGTDVPTLSCGLLTGLTVTFTVSDECGNTAACTKTVYLDDETDPAIDCSGVNDLVLVCMEGADYATQIESWITAAKATILGDMQTTDACDATLVITDNYNGTDIPTLSCTQSSGLMVIFTVTDDCGNAAVCTKTVYLDDNTNPTIDCSGVTDLTLMCMEGADYAAQIEAWIAAAKVTILADPQTDDSCDGTLAISDDYNGSALPSFSCDLSSGLVVTFTVVDECGNTAACTKTVYLDDNGMPTIDCSGVNDLVLVCVENADYAAQIESWITAAKATILADPQTDDACDAMLSIVDDYNGTAVPSLSCNLTTGLTVTFTVSDECGNTAACTKTVYLDDNTNPTIDCSGVSDLVLECVNGANYASQIEAWITAAKATILADPQTDDACDGTLAIVDDYNGTDVPTLSCGLLTGLTVTFTVSDECGNTAACTKTVYLDDETDPVIDCSGVNDLVLVCMEGADYATQIESWITAAKATILGDMQTTDACDATLVITDNYNGTDIPTLSCTQSSGLMVTFTVTDDCGNAAACTKTVYLDDNTNPTIDCSGVTDLTLMCMDGADYAAQIEAWIAAAKVTILADPQTDDSCDGTLAISDDYNGSALPPFSCDLSSGLVVTFTVVDECGNTAACTKTVYLDDNALPTIDCSGVNDLVLVCVEGADYAAQIESWITAAKATILADPQTDDACDAMLSIVDDYNGTAVPTLSCNLTTGLTVTFTVSDECGNTAACTKTVYLDDNTNPTIDCSNVTNLVMECVGGADYPAQIEAWIAAAKLTILADPQTDDACDGSLAISDNYNGTDVPALSCDLSTGLTVVFTVTDECGNAATCAKTVYIDDTTLPTIDCSNVTNLVMECVDGADYPAQIEAWIAAAKLTILADPQTDDACDVLLAISDNYNGTDVPALSCDLSAGLTVVFTVTDECGNAATCAKTVYIDDTTLPTIDCSNVTNLVMECVDGADYPAQIEAWIAAAKLTILADPQTDDACDVSLAISDNYNGTDVPALSCDLSAGLTVVFTVTDECGNAATCAKTVYIDDTTLPTIDCSNVTNLVMECVDGADYPAQIEAWIAAAKLTILADPQTDDACDVSLAISDNYNGTDVPALSCDLSTGLTVVFTVTDECGNAATCAKTVYIDDTVAPVWDVNACTNIGMETINSDANCNAVMPDLRGDALLQLTENCDELTVTDIIQVPAPGSPLTPPVGFDGCGPIGPVVYAVDVTFNVMDFCGNAAVELACDDLVKVQDVTAPTWDANACTNIGMETINANADCDAVMPDLRADALLQLTENCDVLTVADIIQVPAPGSPLTPPVGFDGCGPVGPVVYTVDVTFNVTDCNGNAAVELACDDLVKVQDVTAPTWDANACTNIGMETINANADCDAVMPDLRADALLQLTENCDVLTVADIIQVPAPGSPLTPPVGFDGCGPVGPVVYTVDVTFNVTDCNGNAAVELACDDLVKVQDVTAPTWDANACTNIGMETINANADCDAVMPDLRADALLQLTENCDVLTVADIIQVPAPGSPLTPPVGFDGCGPVGPVVYTVDVTFNVTDCNGNAAVELACDDLVKVQDVTAPTWDANACTNIGMETINANADCDAVMPDLRADALLQLTENCDVLTVADIIQVPAPGSPLTPPVGFDGCGPVGPVVYTVDVTFNVTDCNGNAAVELACDDLVKVQDVTAPTWDANACTNIGMETINANADCDAVMPDLRADALLQLTENCDVLTVADIIQVPAPGSPLTPPVGFDGCGPVGPVVYTVDVTFNVTDCNGNAAVELACDDLVKVQDVTAPTWDANACTNIGMETINANADCDAVMPDLRADALLQLTENCDVLTVADIIQVPAPGSPLTPPMGFDGCGPVGPVVYTVDVTFNVTDCNGNAAVELACDDLVKVQDVTAPTWDANACTNIGMETINANADCDAVMPDLRADALLQLTENCDVLTVADIIQVPAPGSPLTPPVGFDGCGPVGPVVYTVDVTFNVTDCNGNAAVELACDDLVKVQDVTAPTWDANACTNIGMETINANADCDAVMPDLRADALLQLTENCDVLTVADIIQVPAPGSPLTPPVGFDGCGPVGPVVYTVDVTFNVTDCNGNAAVELACDDLVKVQDVTAPTWDANACTNIGMETINANADCDAVMPDLRADALLQLTENCDILTVADIIQVPAPGSPLTPPVGFDGCGPVGPVVYTVDVTFNVTDCNGNAAVELACDDLVKVQDVTAPTWDANACTNIGMETINANADCDAVMPDLRGDALLQLTENCDVLTVADIIQVPAPGSPLTPPVGFDGCGPVGPVVYTVDVTFNVTDCNGNAAVELACDDLVKVQDVTAPTWDANACTNIGMETINANADCDAVMPDLRGDALLQLTENCDVLTVADIIQVPAPGSPLTPPVGFDGCGPVGPVVYTVDVTFNVTDCNGNAAVELACDDLVKVQDVTAPTWDANACTNIGMETINANADCDAVMPDLRADALLQLTENCDVLTVADIIQVPAPGSPLTPPVGFDGCGPVGPVVYTVDVTFNVTDCNGNAAVELACDDLVKVQDVTAPTWDANACTNIGMETINANADCDAVMPDLRADALLQLTENCNVLTVADIIQVPAPGSPLTPPVGFDGCGPVGPVVYTVDVTFNVTDCNGNAAVELACDDLVKVQDVTAPTWDANACTNIGMETINANADCDAVMPDLRADALLQLTENCDVLTVADIIQVPAPGSPLTPPVGFDGCGPVGPVVYTVDVTFNVTDCNGNAAVELACDDLVKVQDVTAPTWDANACTNIGMETINANADCDAVMPDLRADALLQLTENCDILTVADIIQVPAPGSPLTPPVGFDGCGPVGPVVYTVDVTFNVTDCNGNAAVELACDDLVKVQDVTAPTWDANACTNIGMETINANADCDAVMPDLRGDALLQLTENCDVLTVADIIQVPAPGSPLTPPVGFDGCGPVGPVVYTVDVTFNVTDCNGNAAVELACDDLVKVQDVTAPTWDADACSHIGMEIVNANADCEAVMPDLRGDALLELTENCDVLTVADIIQFPAPGSPLTPPVGFDGCGPDGAVVYAIDVTFNVTDCNGNAALPLSCTGLVKVQDVTAPTWDADACSHIGMEIVNANADCEAVMPDLRGDALLELTENCDVLTVADIIQFPAPGSPLTPPVGFDGCGPNGAVVYAIDVTFNVTDCNGNAALPLSCTGLVKVQDVTAPTWDADACSHIGMEIVNANADCEAVMPDLRGDALLELTENCDVLTVADIIQFPAPGSPLTPPVGFDGCGPDGAVVYAIDVTFNVTDCNGNAALPLSCTGLVKVQDVTAPTWDADACSHIGMEIVNANADCEAVMPDLRGDALLELTENCDVLTVADIIQFPAPGSPLTPPVGFDGCGPNGAVVYAIDVTFNVTDCNGNAALPLSCTGLVKVQDVTAPTWDADACSHIGMEIVNANADCEAVMPDLRGDALLELTENCDVLTVADIIQFPAPGSPLTPPVGFDGCGPDGAVVYAIDVTFNVTDCNGNAALPLSCTGLVKVQDVTAPTWDADACSHIGMEIVNANADCEAVMPDLRGDALLELTENCDVLTVADIIQFPAPGSPLTPPVGFDGCGPNGAVVYAIDVTFNVTDCNGNAALPLSCTGLVKVQDVTAPTWDADACSHIGMEIVNANADCEAVMPDLRGDALLELTENCDVLTVADIIQFPAPGSPLTPPVGFDGCGPNGAVVYAIDVTFNVTDCNGNAALPLSCTGLVKVQDVTAPTWDADACSHIGMEIVNANADCEAVMPDLRGDALLELTENCDVLTVADIIQFPAPGSPLTPPVGFDGCGPDGAVVYAIDVTFNVTDCNGNAALPLSCTGLVKVQDVTAPTWDADACSHIGMEIVNANADCEAVMPDLRGDALLELTENCDVLTVADIIQFPAPGSPLTPPVGFDGCGPNGAVVYAIDVTFNVTDCNGNAALPLSCTGLVKVQDVTAPTWDADACSHIGMEIVNANADCEAVMPDLRGDALLELTENCDVLTVADIIQFPAPGSPLTPPVGFDGCGPNGAVVYAIDVTFNVTDCNGNAALPLSCTGLVKVQDVTAPTWDADACSHIGMEIVNANADCEAVMPDLRGDALLELTENCDVLTVADIIQFPAPGSPLTPPVGFDGCGPDGAVVYAIDVTFNVTDCNGNAALPLSCTGLVKVQDVTAPTWDADACSHIGMEIVNANADCEAVMPDLRGDALLELTENCDVLTVADIIQFPAPGSPLTPPVGFDGCGPNGAVVYAIDVTFNVTDCNGNAALPLSCTGLVKVQDVTAPTWDADACSHIGMEIVNANADCEAVMPDLRGDALLELTENCDVLTVADIIQFPAPGSPLTPPVGFDGCGPDGAVVYAIDVTFNVTDCNGNAALPLSCTGLVKVQDVTAPTWDADACSHIGMEIVNANADCEAVMPDLRGDALLELTENCDVLTVADIIQFPAPGSPLTPPVGFDGCGPNGPVVYTIPVTFNVTDCNGNAALPLSCPDLVKVQDVTAPTWDADACSHIGMEIVNANADCEAVMPDLRGDALLELTENCDVLTVADIIQFPAPGSPLTPPVGFDGCGPDGAVVYAIDVTFNVTDCNGNAALPLSCTGLVKVQDVTAPTWDADACSHIGMEIVNANADCEAVMPDLRGDALLELTENCDVLTVADIIQFPAPGSPLTPPVGFDGCGPDGAVVYAIDVTFNVTDCNGNAALPLSCTGLVKVQDVTAPTWDADACSHIGMEIVNGNADCEAVMPDLRGDALLELTENCDVLTVADIIQFPAPGSPLTPPVGFDGCGPNGPVVYTIPVTFNVTDCNGNAALPLSCPDLVKVQDVTAPTWDADACSHIGMEIVNANADCEAVMPDLRGDALLELTENCDVLTVADIIQFPAPGSPLTPPVGFDGCGPDGAVVYAIDVTFNVTDCNGNAALPLSCTGLVKVQDVTAPTWDADACSHIGMEIVNGNADCEAVMPDLRGDALLELTENCDVLTVADIIQFPAPGSPLTPPVGFDGCGPNGAVVYAIDVTFNVTDCNGNAALPLSCTGLVKVQDVTAPTWDADACSHIGMEIVNANADCEAVMPDLRGDALLELTENCDVLTVADIIQFPAPGSPLTPPVGFDGCGPNGAVVYAIDVTFNVTDCNGNAALPLSCTGLVKVQDVTAPTWDADACSHIGMEIVNANADCEAVMPDLRGDALLELTENCDVLTVADIIQFPAPGSPLTPPVGFDGCGPNGAVVYAIDVTFNVTDCNGNAALPLSCTGLVKVQDVTAPTWDADACSHIGMEIVNANADCEAVMPDLRGDALLELTENCDVLTVADIIQFPAPGSPLTPPVGFDGCGPDGAVVYAIDVTFNVTDCNGNAALPLSCTGLVKVQDVTAPTWDADACSHIGMEIVNANADCEAVMPDLRGDALLELTENCDVLTVADIIQFPAPGSPLTPPVGFDGCGPDGAVVYAIDVTFNVTDCNGNAALPLSCTGLVKVQDVTAPTWDADACSHIGMEIVNANADCEAVMPDLRGDALLELTENCDVLTVADIIQFPAPGSPLTPPVGFDGCGPDGAVVYAIDVTFNVTDCNGNAALPLSCTGLVKVQDVTAPTWDADACSHIGMEIVNANADCEAVMPDLRGDALLELTENCDVLTVADIIQFPAPGSLLIPPIDFIGCGPNAPVAYAIDVTFNVTDCNGNAALPLSCTGLVKVQDVTPPSITCPNAITIECTDSTDPDINASLGEATAFDNCTQPVVTYSDVTTGGACPQEYTITRTWKAIDGCGNMSTCNQVIIVEDSKAPVLTCPSSLTIECTASTLPANTGNATATDNCDEAPEITWSDVTVGGEGYCGPEYGIIRTWKAEDACGNSSTCNQTITIRDNVPPVCSTQDISITQIIDPDTGYVLITPQMIDNGSSDNCDGPVFLSIYPDTLFCENEGNNLVILTVSDACGNTSTCTAIVTLDCIDPCVHIAGWVYLEGAATDPNGVPNAYTIPMRTDLNDLQILPGQTLVDPFFGNKYTPAGQPYSIAPWNYPGTEGALFDSGGDPMMGDAGYPSTVVDWILVSLREDSLGTDGPVCQAAALLHNDGHIQFVEDFDCCDLDLYTTYYLVLEHRNHLIVMSHLELPIDLGNSTITYDFRNQQSFIDDPFGFGTFSAQKEILPGIFAMIAGNGDQTLTNQSDTDVNFDDRTFWEGENGDIGEYRIGDYNLNGDTNFNDRVTWERNNGKFTSVPRN